LLPVTVMTLPAWLAEVALMVLFTGTETALPLLL